MVHKNNFRRRQRRSESRLDETVRVASIVQKGIASGRSSYVEMRALERIVRHNLVLKVQLVKESGAFTKDGEFAELLARASQAHTGYSDTITPNGVLSKNDLDSLLTIDSEISTCLAMMASPGSRAKWKELKETLEELLEERKRLVGSLRA